MNSPIITSAKSKWEALGEREQLSLKVMAVALLLAIAYFALWLPAKTYMENTERLMEERIELLSLVQSSRSVLAQSTATASSGESLNSQQLVSTVTNMARTQKLSLKRFEPSGDDKVKVWVEDVSFDLLVAWLASLDKSVNVKVEQISVEKQDKPGVVSARLTLKS